MGAYTDIPRFYTALAEWLMCVLYISLFPKKWSKGITVAICAGFLVIQTVFMVLTEEIALIFWIPVMLLAITLMFGTIYVCTDGSLALVGYNCAKAFLLAEFTASLEWQLSCFFRDATGQENMVLQLLMLFGIYTLLFFAAFRLERKMQSYRYCSNIAVKEMMTVVFIVLFAFIFSNLSFVVTDSPFSGSSTADIFNVRTMGDLCGLVILYAYQMKICEYMIEKELAAIQSVHKKQYDQYRYYQNSMEMIHIKYHDLKHQIMGLRGEKDEKNREEWLDHLEEELDENRLIHQTGNDVLDTILAAKIFHAQKYKATITCVADGKLLSSMHVADICTIFGNALDNALESVVTIEDPKKRLIHLTLSQQKGFVLINISNYMDKKIELTRGQLPQTSKKDKENHGYGLKSIQKTVEKYKGSMSIQTKEHWFELRILLPEMK